MIDPQSIACGVAAGCARATAALPVVALVEKFREWGRMLSRELRVFWNREPPKPLDRHWPPNSILAEGDSLPIRLRHTPAACWVCPVAGIKLGIGRCLYITGDAEQRAESVERVEAPVKAKREFVEVGL